MISTLNVYYIYYLEIYVHILKEKYTAVIYNSLLTFLDIIDGRIYGPPTSRRCIICTGQLPTSAAHTHVSTDIYI